VEVLRHHSWSWHKMKVSGELQAPADLLPVKPGTVPIGYEWGTSETRGRWRRQVRIKQMRFLRPVPHKFRLYFRLPGLRSVLTINWKSEMYLIKTIIPEWRNYVKRFAGIPVFIPNCITKYKSSYCVSRARGFSNNSNNAAPWRGEDQVLQCVAMVTV
jgi:hypothetical protein